MKVPDPARDADGYFVLPRRCRACAGNNVIELDGAISVVRQQRRARRQSDTQTTRSSSPKNLVA